MTERPVSVQFGAEHRRSTRILHAIPLRVAGVDATGRRTEEQTGTLSINCHGCRYFSKYQFAKNAWLTLEIPGEPARATPRRMKARVAWTSKSRWLRGVFQVGVEFESPGNIWGIATPPEDWKRFAAPEAFDAAEFEREMTRLLWLAKNGTYYQLLGVTAQSSCAQVKRRFHELARQYHPDLHMSHSEWSRPLQALMDALTLAYRTLSRAGSREEYDRRLAGSDAFKLGPKKADSRRTVDECLKKARECLALENHLGSIVWLRKAVEIEPTSSKYHALLAQSLGTVPGYRREAIEHFERALELDPLNFSAHLQFGFLYEAMNLPWRARPHYEKILETNPGSAEARERLRQLDSSAKKNRREQPLLGRLFGYRSK